MRKEFATPGIDGHAKRRQRRLFVLQAEFVLRMVPVGDPKAAVETIRQVDLLGLLIDGQMLQIESPLIACLGKVFN